MTLRHQVRVPVAPGPALPPAAGAPLQAGGYASIDRCRAGCEVAPVSQHASPAVDDAGLCEQTLYADARCAASTVSGNGDESRSWQGAPRGNRRAFDDTSTMLQLTATLTFTMR